MFMAGIYCDITLYAGIPLDPDKNYIIDNIDEFLAVKQENYAFIHNFQYQRFELNKTIKVNRNQLESGNSVTMDGKKWNYCLIQTIDKDTGDLLDEYYYFIIGIHQKAQETIELELQMDVLNTFKYHNNDYTSKNYSLSPKTLVNREHKNRISSNFIIDGKKLSGHTPEANMTYGAKVSMFGVGTDTYLNANSHYKMFVVRDGHQGPVYECKGQLQKLRLPSPPTAPTQFVSHDMNNEEVRISVTSTYRSQSYFVIEFIDNLETEDSLFVAALALYESSNPNTCIYDVYYLYPRIIDEYQEGLGTTLFKKDEETLFDGDKTNQWYVVFASSVAVVATANATQPIYVNPVQIRLYCDLGYKMQTELSHEVVLYATATIIPNFKWEPETIYCSPNSYVSRPASTGILYVKINGTTYDFYDYDMFSAKRTNNTDTFFSKVTIYDRNDLTHPIEITNVDSVTFYGFNNLYVYGTWSYQIIYIGAGGGTYSGTSPRWDEVDLTDEKLIKAFAFPYAPLEFLVSKNGWRNTFDSLPEGMNFTTDNVIEIASPQLVPLSYQKIFDVESPMSNVYLRLKAPTEYSSLQTERDIKYESKMYHSDFYQPKFVYDSFSFMFMLENINVSALTENYPNIHQFMTTYTISRNVQSKFMFQFNQYVLKKSIQDYDGLLCIERNNEKALYNSAYINYIRSGGYNYDTKKASSQNAINGVTTALSIIGAIGSFASTPYTGAKGVVAGMALTSTAITSIMRSVHTAQEQDRAISQKLVQSQMQGTSVQGSEDIDILTEFSGNKPKLVYYELSDIMKQAMFDLFYYCGYATHEQKIPNVTTRMYFNYVQADIVYEHYSFNEVIAQEIKNKWKEGVTFFHDFDGIGADYEQQYENFENDF